MVGCVRGAECNDYLFKNFAPLPYGELVTTEILHHSQQAVGAGSLLSLGK